MLIQSESLVRGATSVIRIHRLRQMVTCRPQKLHQRRRQFMVAMSSAQKFEFPSRDDDWATASFSMGRSYHGPIDQTHPFFRRHAASKESAPTRFQARSDQTAL